MKKIAVAFMLACGWAGAAQADLIHNYTFEEPAPLPNSPLVDIGTNATNVPLLNGATQAPVGAGAPVGSTQALQTADATQDAKAAIFSQTGVGSMTGTAGVTGLTYSVWINPSAYNGTGTAVNTVMSIGAGGAANSGQSRANLSILANGGVRAGGRKLDADGFRNVLSTGTGLVPLNTWTHLAAVYRYDAVNATNGSIQLYVNGQPVATGTLQGGAWGAGTTTSATNANGIIFGNANASATTHSEPFTGLIDNARVYNSQLTDVEVLEIFNAQAVPEPSTLVLAGLAGIGMVVIARRRRAA